VKEITMKNLRYVIFYLGALLASPALSASPEQNSDLVEPLTYLYKDLKLGPENVTDAIKLKVLGNFFSGAIHQHGGTYIDTPLKAIPMIEYLTSRRVVMADGRMASVYYHEAIKERLGGELRLQNGQYISWQKKYPESAEPVIFTASNMLSAYAYQLRLALITKMPVEGIEFDRRKVEDVQAYLLANKSLGAQDPYWYNLLVETQIFLRVSEAELKSTVAEGLRKFPQNVELPTLASSYYYSKWQGDASKLNDFASWVIAEPFGKSRTDIYPRIYFNALQTQYGLTLFKLVPKDWTLMRNGIDHLMSAFADRANRDRSSLLACLGGDRALTKTMMAVDDGMVNQAIWIDRDAKDLCKSWARG
jgi:hypothetical protein